MKMYAKQVPPECQESPLFLEPEFWPENVFVFGNRDFNQHADTLNALKTALENIVGVFDDMQTGHGWTINLAHAIHCELPPQYRREYSRPERLKLVELAQEYGFAKSWEENGILCEVLELITGISWDHGTIRGCCQGDWQEIIFPADHGREWLNYFETEYFNTGTEWIIDSDGDSISIYAHAWGNDGIKKELADAIGTEPENIILQTFSKWERTAVYVEV